MKLFIMSDYNSIFVVKSGMLNKWALIMMTSIFHFWIISFLLNFLAQWNFISFWWGLQTKYFFRKILNRHNFKNNRKLLKIYIFLEICQTLHRICELQFPMQNLFSISVTIHIEGFSLAEKSRRLNIWQQFVIMFLQKQISLLPS